MAMASSAHGDPMNQPVPWKERGQRDLHYHQAEWTSGTRGGGSLPSDFRWTTNPKQRQEENGAAAVLRSMERG